jgi:tetratricopeptide (TPR) repeat protein
MKGIMMGVILHKKTDTSMRFGLSMVLLLTALLFPACSSQSTLLKGDKNRRALADHYYNKKEYHKAKDELQSIVIENPDDAESLFRLGVIYGHEGSTNASYTAFKKVISIDPNYSKAYYNIGVLYANSKSATGKKISVRYFSKFLELEPDTQYRQEIERWKSSHLNH